MCNHRKRHFPYTKHRVIPLILPPNVQRLLRVLARNWPWVGMWDSRTRPGHPQTNSTVAKVSPMRALIRASLKFPCILCKLARMRGIGFQIIRDGHLF